MTDALLFVLMSLASYRLWRVIGRDEWPPSKWLREAIDHRVRFEKLPDLPDSVTGVERSRVSNPTGFWHEVRVMVECPWCLGFWISAAVVITTDLTLLWLRGRGIVVPPLQVLAVSCVVGLIGNADG